MPVGDRQIQDGARGWHRCAGPRRRGVGARQPDGQGRQSIKGIYRHRNNPGPCRPFRSDRRAIRTRSSCERRERVYLPAAVPKRATTSCFRRRASSSRAVDVRRRRVPTNSRLAGISCHMQGAAHEPFAPARPLKRSSIRPSFVAKFNASRLNQQPSTPAHSFSTHHVSDNGAPVMASDYRYASLIGPGRSYSFDAYHSKRPAQMLVRPTRRTRPSATHVRRPRVAGSGFPALFLLAVSCLCA